MKRLSIPTLVLACGWMALPSSLPAMRQAGDARARLQRALAWLQQNETTFDAPTRRQMPALRAILQRYYLDDASLTATEADIAEAITRGMPGDSSTELVTRDPAAKLKELRAALHKAPGMATRPTFTPGVRDTPGGKRIGYIDVTMQGRRRTVVELLSAPGRTSLLERARIIARDMQTVQQAQPLWWTQMSVGRARSEYVVKAPGAPRGYLITADHAFAHEWGLSRPALAAQLVATVRRTFDPEKGSRIAMRDAAPTPGELRDEAVELRQQGDGLYAKAPGEAEARYREAIQKDPSYAVPYLRVADLCVAAHRAADARSILQQALQAEGVPADQRAEVERRLAQIR